MLYPIEDVRASVQPKSVDAEVDHRGDEVPFVRIFTLPPARRRAAPALGAGGVEIELDLDGAIELALRILVLARTEQQGGAQ